MEEIIIACEKIDGPRAFHRLLAKELAFPAWYGSNLDALYDCLTEMREMEVEFRDTAEMLMALGRYGEKLLEVFREAET